MRVENANQWRPLIAILASPETRRVAAQIMLGANLDAVTEGLSPSKRLRVIEAVVNSGLVEADSRTFAPNVFREILQSAPVAKRQGIERFVEGKRIRQYPANAGERGELLAWVAQDAFESGAILTERQVNQRLLPYADDVAVLRRYLVDYELVERRADGSEYTLTGIGPMVG